jgi:hypothetical protein
MNHLATRLLGVALMLVASMALVGCDDEITSVEDIDIQPSLEVPGSVSLVLLDQNSRTDFSISYQGLDEAPTVQATGNLVVELVEESGSASEGGERRWSVGYDGSVSGVVGETITITTRGEGQSIEEEIGVTVSSFTITTDFQPNFLVIEDYETAFVDEEGSGNPVAQHPVVAEGGSAFAVQSDQVSENSNGVNAAQIEAVAGDPIVIENRVSAPGADLFTFLVRSTNASFTITFTFTEEVNGEVTQHELEVPIPEGDAWRKYSIEFALISEDFDPVAARAGGSGSLRSVSLTADADVTFEVDEFMLGTEEGPIAEINDFETTTNAYVTFCGGQYSFSDQVADEALGARSRRLGGNGCFGYNQAGTRIENASNGSLDFRVGDVAEDTELEVFLELSQGGGTATTISVEAGSEWRNVSIPISDLAEDPSALAGGISNVGFSPVSGASSFLLDDIRIDATGN